MGYFLIRKFKFSVLPVLTTLAFLAFARPCAAQWDKDVFYYRGRQALAESKFSQAMENFNILARLDTTDYWTFFFRGIAKYNLGDIRGASRDFDRSVRLNPVFTSGYHYRAITSSRFGEYDKALEDLEKALSLRPGYEGLYFSRGVTYFLNREFDKAVSDFDYYIRRQPKDPSAYLNRGAAKLYLADTTGAFQDYDKAIKLDRHEPEAWLRRGRLFAVTGEYSKALDDMNMAIKLDSSATVAYFGRALLYYELKDYKSAMADLDRVLREEPGNALTLYNRSLIYAQVGDFGNALQDMDRVLNINPRNVLAYFNRASYFVQMERWRDALEDYDAAIELYPDFAKAYLNRSYVKSRLGMSREAGRDYETAQEKIRQYHGTDEASFADTTRKYSSLLALDADFAKKDFDDELLQHRDVDVRLRPLYKFSTTDDREMVRYALSQHYENPLLDKFIREAPVNLRLSSGAPAGGGAMDNSARAGAIGEFVKAICAENEKRYNSALAHYDNAIGDSAPGSPEEGLYKAFYLMNRGVLRAEMIDFISSMENNVHTLTMDDRGNTRARVQERISRNYDYSEAILDLLAASKLLPGLPHIHFDLGNLYCLSSNFIEAIDSYSLAISLYAAMGDAYFNRGLVQIYLKDKEKGCMDLSRAGELGVKDAYSLISKYCESDGE